MADKTETPETDALHTKLLRISEGPEWVVGKDYCDMREHAESLERRLRAAESAQAPVAGEVAEISRKLYEVSTRCDHHYSLDRTAATMLESLSAQVEALKRENVKLRGWILEAEQAAGGLLLNVGFLSNLARRVFIRGALRFPIRELARHCSAQLPVYPRLFAKEFHRRGQHWLRVCFPRRAT